jgi:hypothetical protein
MPGNLANAAQNGVMPYALCTAFSESREYVQLQTQYHDGAIQRSQLAQTSRRTFSLSQRLTAALAIALKAFWDTQQGGAVPFVFYNLIEGNYDPTGNSTQGRYTSGSRGAGRKTAASPAPTFRSCSWSKSHNPCPTQSAASRCRRSSAPV